MCFKLSSHRGFFYYPICYSKTIDQIRKFDIAISQSGQANNNNNLVEVRRFVAIVPYRQRGDAKWLTFVNSLVNVAVLLVWLFGAALFAAILVGMRWLVLPFNGRRRRRLTETKLTTFFRCLAGVLGNSWGAAHFCWTAEWLVMCVIGVFATFTSMLFTGALFEQLLDVEPAKQIDTLPELAASNLTVYVCYGDTFKR